MVPYSNGGVRYGMVDRHGVLGDHRRWDRTVDLVWRITTEEIVFVSGQEYYAGPSFPNSKMIRDRISILGYLVLASGRGRRTHVMPDSAIGAE